MRKLIVLIFAVFLVSHLFAQTECEVKLQKATLAFQNGEYVNCDPLFHDMIANCKWTPDEKKQIYKLYIATLFELDKITEGRETIYQFILAFPNYIPNATTDPVLFVENFDNFDSRPRLAIGFKAGGLHFTPLRTKINTPWADANYQLDYTGVKGINTLVVLDYYFTKNWILSSGLGVDWVTYTRDIPDNSGHHLNYSEEYFTVQIPATISYQRPIFRNVSLRLGLSAAVVKPVVALGSASFSDDNKVTSNQELVRDVDILNSRTPLILEFGSHLAINYHLRSWMFFVDFNFIRSFNNIATDNRLNNTNSREFEERFLYIDDDFSYYKTSFTLGLSATISHKVKFRFK